MHQCSEQAGRLRIYDLRDRHCPNRPRAVPAGPPGVPVTLQNVVVTSLFQSLLTVAEPEGGAYSAIWVYNKDGRVDVSALRIGTRVNIEGKYLVFYGLDEISLDAVEVVGHGEPLPPILIEEPAEVATDAPLAEPLQGNLLRIEDARVATTKPDCPNDFGEFMITGRLRIDDLAGVDYVPLPGDHIISVTGVLNYAFGNTKLEPRNAEDLQVVGCNHRPDKCEGVECIEEDDAVETGMLVVTEIQYDPRGPDSAGEWFEVFNPGAQAVDLRGWVLRSCASATYTIPAGGPALAVPPRGYAVLGCNADRRSNGGITVLHAFDPARFFLSNTEGSILLYDAQGQLVDQVRYSGFAPWPGGEPGQSLMLRDPGLPNLGPDNWARSSTQREDGTRCTPGAANR
ncbi:MAG: lamin tail domain-containing protein [Deltaproteobacteria bacterium]|nr:lamin tail domain-containing protein [Deltaproteobacteria bacterium]